VKIGLLCFFGKMNINVDENYNTTKKMGKGSLPFSSEDNSKILWQCVDAVKKSRLENK